MVLAWGEDEDIFAVVECEYRDFGAFEFFFDKDFVSGVAEDFFTEDLVDGVEGFFGGVWDDDAFAFGKPGGFDDEGFVPGIHVIVGVVGVSECFAFGGWDGGGTHDLFGVGLVCFELCAAL